MIIPLDPLGMSSGTSGGSIAVEYDFSPSEGGLVVIPESSALVVNVLLWPTSPLISATLKIPDALVAGRRIFIYMASNSIAQLTVTAASGVTVSNNVVTMNLNDLVVFNTVSTTSMIIARVATS